MVARKHQGLACRSFELDDIDHPLAGKTHEHGQPAKTSPGLPNYSGLDLEKTSRPPVEAELFSWHPFL